MKTISLLITVLFFYLSSDAQVNKKDTVNTDSSHIEKIKKMPMDTIHPHPMPVKPLLPEEQRNKKRNNDEPITPSGGAKKPKSK